MVMSGMDSMASSSRSLVGMSRMTTAAGFMGAGAGGLAQRCSYKYPSGKRCPNAATKWLKRKHLCTKHYKQLSK